MSERLEHDVMEQLAEAFIEYQDRIKTIFEEQSDEQLLAFVGTIPPDDDRFVGAYERYDEDLRVAAMHVYNMRVVCRLADEALKRSDSTGVFCVYHRCDMKDCVEYHQ